MLRRALLLLTFCFALLGGAPFARAAAEGDADLAAQAAEILSLERVARDTDDVAVRDAARRQIGRLEDRARSRAAEELGRDLFRERVSGREGRGGREGEFRPRDVRVFGGREVVRPPFARDREGRGGETREVEDRDDDGRDDEDRDDDDREDDAREDDARDDERDEPNEPDEPDDDE